MVPNWRPLSLSSRDAAHETCYTKSMGKNEPQEKTDSSKGASKGASKGERIAKVMARAGVCSRREAERYIADGRVMLDDKPVETPATLVTPENEIKVDGKPIPKPESARLWLYHKPSGLVTTHSDPQGRSTVFDALPKDLPRVISVGRLDFNSEGLLLLTNDGELARRLELPATGWKRRYRVRVHGRITQEDLNKLADGVRVDGVNYGPIEAKIDRAMGSNTWILMGLREGKNREIRRVLGHLGFDVARLIRVGFGPFELATLEAGAVKEVPQRTLADQLGGLKPDEPKQSLKQKLKQKRDKKQKRTAGNEAPGRVLADQRGSSKAPRPQKVTKTKLPGARRRG